MLIAIFIGAFFWNEARKEIVFLCRNFEKGVLEQSVIKQLETGNFLQYQIEKRPSGKRIIVDSAYNFYMYRCIIDIDEGSKVEEARVES